MFDQLINIAFDILPPYWVLRVDCVSEPGRDGDVVIEDLIPQPRDVFHAGVTWTQVMVEVDVHRTPPL